jgi:hypothetical protein
MVAQAGRFTLRAERIGHRTITSAAFTLAAGAASTVDLVVPVAAIEIAPIDVGAENRCLRRNQSLRTAQLWEEARKALRVASWVERRRGTRFVARSYTRELDATSRQVLSEKVRMLLSSSRPYAAISADSAVRFGFVHQAADGLTYHGPDAELLLSDEFLDRHCFYTISGSKQNAGMIGLAFQPTLDLKVPSIKGVLWLDQQSLALQHIDFEYVNIPPEYRVRDAGGRTAFQRLNSGAWIVSRWHIRMPTAVAGRQQGFRPLALREEGGEILSLRDPVLGTDSARNVTAIAGVVYDSVHARPLGGALVYLSGTTYRTVADAAGRYRLEAVRLGVYHVAFAHPVLDSLPADAATTTAVSARGDTVIVNLGIPPLQQLQTGACPGAVDSTAAFIFGYVHDARGVGVADATVHAIVGERQLTAQTGAAGYYLLCGVPRRGAFDLRAFNRLHESGIQQTRLNGAHFQRIDLQWKD